LPSRWSFSNFGVALSSGFGRWLLNSVIVTPVAVIMTTGLAALAAWGYARWRFAGKQTDRTPDVLRNAHTLLPGPPADRVRHG